ncbi:MAG: endonuclease/exonuclease/phosphatase family protein [Bacteroidota bacterium]
MHQKHLIAFYNLENLFDTTDNRYVLDDDFTPNGKKKWNKRRYDRKLRKLAHAISRIGEKEGVHPPVIIGVAEVENDRVLKALLAQKEIAHLDYDFVHFDSPDERGIDTGLLYNTQHFQVVFAETLPLLITDQEGNRDYTRDILYVNGKLNNETLHLFVNHWPSRREGPEKTKHKRIEAANTILRKLDTLDGPIEQQHIIIMGDFNDEPSSESIKTLMNSGRFINPMQPLLTPETGSANYKGTWSLFDQIILSHNFLNYEKGTHRFAKAGVFSPSFLRQQKGRFRGIPFRTYAGKKYLAGYSDHFPVYVMMHFNE